MLPAGDVMPLNWIRRLLSAAAAGRRPEPLVLYTRAGCHLCDAMKAEIARVRTPLTLREVDIAADPALEAAYGRSIPVLEIRGRAAFKGRLTAAELERELARLPAPTPPSPPPPPTPPIPPGPQAPRSPRRPSR